jgi:hypothetical protein
VEQKLRWCVQIDPTKQPTRTTSSSAGQLNESRSAVIEDYRRTAESIEATTARARESTAYSTAINDYRAVKELHETLNEKHSEAVKIVQKYQQIVQNYQNRLSQQIFHKLFKRT